MDPTKNYLDAQLAQYMQQNTAGTQQEAASTDQNAAQQAQAAAMQTPEYQAYFQQYMQMMMQMQQGQQQPGAPNALASASAYPYYYNYGYMGAGYPSATGTDQQGLLSMTSTYPDMNIQQSDLSQITQTSIPQPYTANQQQPHNTFQANMLQQNVNNTNLWIGDVTNQLDEQDLTQYFSQYGPIRAVRILRQKNCAFVSFQDPQDASKTFKSGTRQRIQGQDIKIGFGKPDPESGNQIEPIQHAQSQEQILEFKKKREYQNADCCSTIWVGSLATNITEQRIRQLFGQFGTIESVKMLPPKGSQQAYAFVTFSSVQEAVLARIQMSNYLLEGLSLKINYAKGKDGASQVSRIQSGSILDTSSSLSFQDPHKSRYSTNAPTQQSSLYSPIPEGVYPTEPPEDEGVERRIHDVLQQCKEQQQRAMSLEGMVISFETALERVKEKLKNQNRQGKKDLMIGSNAGTTGVFQQEYGFLTDKDAEGASYLAWLHYVESEKMPLEEARRLVLVELKRARKKIPTLTHHTESIIKRQREIIQRAADDGDEQAVRALAAMPINMGSNRLGSQAIPTPQYTADECSAITEWLCKGWPKVVRDVGNSDTTPVSAEQHVRNSVNEDTAALFARVILSEWEGKDKQVDLTVPLPSPNTSYYQSAAQSIPFATTKPAGQEGRIAIAKLLAQIYINNRDSSVRKELRSFLAWILRSTYQETLDRGQRRAILDIVGQMLDAGALESLEEHADIITVIKKRGPRVPPQQTQADTIQPNMPFQSASNTQQSIQSSSSSATGAQMTSIQQQVELAKQRVKEIQERQKREKQSQEQPQAQIQEQQNVPQFQQAQQQEQPQTSSVIDFGAPLQSQAALFQNFRRQQVSPSSSSMRDNIQDQGFITEKVKRKREDEQESDKSTNNTDKGVKRRQLDFIEQLDDPNDIFI